MCKGLHVIDAFILSTFIIIQRIKANVIPSGYYLQNKFTCEITTRLFGIWHVSITKSALEQMYSEISNSGD